MASLTDSSDKQKTVLPVSFPLIWYIRQKSSSSFTLHPSTSLQKPPLRSIPTTRVFILSELHFLQTRWIKNKHYRPDISVASTCHHKVYPKLIGLTRQYGKCKHVSLLFYWWASCCRLNSTLHFSTNAFPPLFSKYPYNALVSFTTCSSFVLKVSGMY